MGLLGKIFGGGIRDQSETEQYEDAIRNPVVAAHLLSACEQLDGATGEFGSQTNPVPVNGPKGEVAYLSCLSDGRPYLYHRRRSLSVPQFPQPLDEFELVSQDSSDWRLLYFSMYHPKRSLGCPPWAKRISWPKDQVLQLMYKMPNLGSMDEVDNFPFGLPEALRNSPILAQMPGNVGAAMADSVKRMLDKHPGKWRRPENH